MDTLSRFDAWVINCMEKRFTHPIQRWVGLNNFDLMPWLFLFFLVIVLLPGIIFANFNALFAGGIFLFWHLICILVIHISGMKDLVMRAMRKGCANPMKIDPVKINARSGLLLTSLLSFMLPRLAEFDVGSSFALFVSCLGIYFLFLLAACDPLPPAKSKLREFFGSLVPWPKLNPIRIRKWGNIV